jgi:D-aminoacyl-tRNA deacylase
MNVALISYSKEIASMNIKDHLISDFQFKELGEQFDGNNIPQYTINNEKNKIIIKLYTINSEMIFAEDLDKKIDADVFVFLSKHKAKEGRASLTCHPIGNFGKAEKGGKDKTLCRSYPSLLKNIFIELDNHVKDSKYEATLEATHHGPFMEKPLLFLELGSNEEYWKDEEGGRIVAESLMSAIEKFNNNINNEKSIIENSNYENVFVLGGGHFSHVGNKAMLSKDLAVGHICSKHNLENLDESLLKEAMEKGNAKFVLLDWKGLGKEKARILEMLEKNNIEFKRSDKF